MILKKNKPTEPIGHISGMLKKQSTFAVFNKVFY